MIPAIPEGSRRITGSDQWLDAISNHPRLAWRRADFRRSILLVAELMLHRVEYVSVTSTPGNDWLEAESGLSPRTVRRTKQWLYAHGFLGLVAQGRSADYTPATSDGWTNLPGSRPEGKTADRAVYVLCLPMSAAELEEYAELEGERMENKSRLGSFLGRFFEAVDVNGHPIPSESKSAPGRKKEWASPTLKDYLRRKAEYMAELAGARTDLSWPLSRTTEAEDKAGARFNELQAARTVKLHSPSLRNVGDEQLRRALATFFRAGYTPSDILHAIDNLPDGRPRRHDGFAGALDPIKVLQGRLRDWKQGEQPIYSVRQRSEIRAARNVARRMEEKKARQAAEADLRSRKQRGMSAQTVAGYTAGVQMLRALFQ